MKMLAYTIQFDSNGKNVINVSSNIELKIVPIRNNYTHVPIVRLYEFTIVPMYIKKNVSLLFR